MDNIPVKKLQTQKMVSLSKKKKRKEKFSSQTVNNIMCIEFTVNNATQSVSSSASRTRNVWCQHHTISKCEGNCTKAAKKNQQTVNSEEL